MSLTTKVKVATFSLLNEKSYNKTVIDLNFGIHKDLSTLKRFWLFCINWMLNNNRINGA